MSTPDCSRCEHRHGPLCSKGGGYPGHSVMFWAQKGLVSDYPGQLYPDNCPLTGAPPSVVGWEVVANAELPPGSWFVRTMDYSTRCIRVVRIEKKEKERP